jgi:16S rRNA (uracil1498-N3)-methyltransferase
MPPRLHVQDLPLAPGAELVLPPGPARHVQVLRLQPGDAVTLFDGRGGEWDARVRAMGRSEVAVDVLARRPVERELPLAVTLAVAMPANDRMDFVVEKAAELGAAAIQPLVAERSVLRLAGERAEKRRAHWQSVAVAAAEQSGRTRVPAVLPVRPLADWLAGAPPAPPGSRWMLSLEADARPVGAQALPLETLTVLSGPEGGLGDAETRAARAAGYVPVDLGPRVLRADTAPLAVLAWLALGTVRR